MVKIYTPTYHLGFQPVWTLWTSIHENEDAHIAFGVFPNPTDGSLSLWLEREWSGQVEASIRDLLGESIVQKDLEKQIGTNTPQFDCSGMTPGMYLMTFTMLDKPISATVHPMIKKIQTAQFSTTLFTQK